MYHTADGEEDILTAWRWLVADVRLLGWSSAADLFVIDAHGAVQRVDTGSGDVERVADSREAFTAMLGDPTRADDLLLLPIVAAFEKTHGCPGPGTCLGFKTLPALGGSYTPENRYAVSASEHAAFTGDVHRQIRDLPDGAQIVIKTVP